MGGLKNLTSGLTQTTVNFSPNYYLNSETDGESLAH
jgi:hypothetical protein